MNISTAAGHAQMTGRLQQVQCRGLASQDQKKTLRVQIKTPWRLAWASPELLDGGGKPEQRAETNNARAHLTISVHRTLQEKKTESHAHLFLVDQTQKRRKPKAMPTCSSQTKLKKRKKTESHAHLFLVDQTQKKEEYRKPCSSVPRRRNSKKKAESRRLLIQQIELLLTSLQNHAMSMFACCCASQTPRLNRE